MSRAPRTSSPSKTDENDGSGIGTRKASVPGSAAKQAARRRPPSTTANGTASGEGTTSPRGPPSTPRDSRGGVAITPRDDGSSGGKAARQAASNARLHTRKTYMSGSAQSKTSSNESTPASKRPGGRLKGGAQSKTSATVSQEALPAADMKATVAVAAANAVASAVAAATTVARQRLAREVGASDSPMKGTSDVSDTVVTRHLVLEKAEDGTSVPTPLIADVGGTISGDAQPTEDGGQVNTTATEEEPSMEQRSPRADIAPPDGSAEANPPSISLKIDDSEAADQASFTTTSRGPSKMDAAESPSGRWSKDEELAKLRSEVEQLRSENLRYRTEVARLTGKDEDSPPKAMEKLSLSISASEPPKFGAKATLYADPPTTVTTSVVPLVTTATSPALLTPGVPTGYQSPGAPVFTFPGGAKVNLPMQMAGSALASNASSRVVSPRRSGVSSVPLPNAGMSARFVQAEPMIGPPAGYPQAAAQLVRPPSTLVPQGVATAGSMTPDMPQAQGTATPKYCQGRAASPGRWSMAPGPRYQLPATAISFVPSIVPPVVPPSPAFAASPRLAPEGVLTPRLARPNTTAPLIAYAPANATAPLLRSSSPIRVSQPPQNGRWEVARMPSVGSAPVAQVARMPTGDLEKAIGVAPKVMPPTASIVTVTSQGVMSPPPMAMPPMLSPRPVI